MSPLNEDLPRKRPASSRKGEDPEYMEKEVRKSNRDKRQTTKYDHALSELKRNTTKKINHNDHSIFDLIMPWKFEEGALSKIVKKKVIPDQNQ